MATPIVLANIDAYLEDSRLPGDAGYIEPLILAPQYGFVPQRFNPGFPDVRDVSDRRPSQNGTFDFTEFFGARSITLEVAVAHELQDDPSVTDSQLEDQLRKWMDPKVRAYLYIKPKNETNYRRALVRSANAASQLSFITNSDFRKIFLTWRGIDGSFESSDVHNETLLSAAATEIGRTYDQAYDKTYATSSVIGAKILHNDGNVDSLPIVSIYGPITQPRIENQTTGQKLEFLAAYALSAGEYLLIDFAEGTVFLNGDTNNSRYDKIDFAGGISEWWALAPGDNFVRFYPLVFADPAQAYVQWRDRYI